jgi:hypothetical protein
LFGRRVGVSPLLEEKVLLPLLSVWYGVDGMIGSLDCLQSKWKNCSVAWKQSFKGRLKGLSTITLEAAAKYNLCDSSGMLPMVLDWCLCVAFVSAP